MENIYLEKNNNLEYFICSYDEDKMLKIASVINSISESAFKNSKIKNIKFENNIKTIKQSAFENCNELENFIIGTIKPEINEQNKSFEKSSNETEIKSGDLILKGIEILKGNEENFTIEKDAFKNCSKLETVILPECKTLIIEKDAFSGCESLRTVVACCDNIDFTDNPFADCSEDLTFVCNKNSKVERFAREHNFRSIWL